MSTPRSLGRYSKPSEGVSPDARTIADLSLDEVKAFGEAAGKQAFAEALGSGLAVPCLLSGELVFVNKSIKRDAAE